MMSYLFLDTWPTCHSKRDGFDSLDYPRALVFGYLLPITSLHVLLYFISNLLLLALYPLVQ